MAMEQTLYTFEMVFRCKDGHPRQRPRWQVDKEAIGLSRVQHVSSICVTRPPEICVNLVLNTFTLAITQSVDNLFHSLIVLCENEYFLISNLH